MWRGGVSNKSGKVIFGVGKCIFFLKFGMYINK
jgi:hypothetical protein